MSEPAIPETVVTTKVKPGDVMRIPRQPPYNVILANDDVHSTDFVVNVLRKVLGCSTERANQLMLEAHTTGRAIIWSGPREVAELKAEQVHSFHESRRPAGTKLGPLGVSIEPAV